MTWGQLCDCTPSWGLCVCVCVCATSRRRPVPCLWPSPAPPKQSPLPHPLPPLWSSSRDTPAWCSPSASAPRGYLTHTFHILTKLVTRYTHSTASTAPDQYWWCHVPQTDSILTVLLCILVSTDCCSILFLDTESILPQTVFRRWWRGHNYCRGKLIQDTSLPPSGDWIWNWRFRLGWHYIHFMKDPSSLYQCVQWPNPCHWNGFTPTLVPYDVLGSYLNMT